MIGMAAGGRGRRVPVLMFTGMAGGPPVAGRDGMSISSRTISGGSREKRTCFDVRRRVVPSSNCTLYER